MTAILRIESRKRLRGTLVLLGIFGVLSAMYLSMFPGVRDEMDEIVEAFPEWMFEMFRLEALHTIEGFLAAEIYSFFWALLLALYFAHVGAGLIAADIHARRMDLTLSNPVSRDSVLLQKVGSLWVPLVILNLGLIVVLSVGAVLIDEPLHSTALVMVHLLSVPYLLVCAAIGVLLSTIIDRDRTAKAIALAVVFVLYLVDAISRMNPDYEWIGLLAPSRYYDYSAILVREEYSLLDASVLLGAFVGLILIALLVFRRRDI